MSSMIYIALAFNASHNSKRSESEFLKGIYIHSSIFKFLIKYKYHIYVLLFRMDI